MMKKLKTLFAFLLVTHLSFSQDLPVDANTNKITYLEVVDAAGLKATDIYKITKAWGEGKKYSIVENKENESIVFSGSFPVEYPNVSGSANDKGKVNFSFSIFSKDGKYRFIATDFVHVAEGKVAGSNGGKLENVSPECGKTKMSAKGWIFIKNKTVTSMKAITDDLKRVVKEAQNDPSKKSDW